MAGISLNVGPHPNDIAYDAFIPFNSTYPVNSERWKNCAEGASFLLGKQVSTLYQIHFSSHRQCEIRVSLLKNVNVQIFIPGRLLQ